MREDLSSLFGSSADQADKERFFSQAFSRNIGLLSRVEQEQLRRSTIGIPGLGGVGGLHLITLARTGIGGFHICDFDQFELQNFNRQYGAKLPAIGVKKLDVMSEEALNINPHLRLRLFDRALDVNTVDEFLTGVDMVVDSLDFFAFDARRLLFRRAREKRIPIVTAGPLGFTCAMLVFTPDSMSFDEYFDINDSLSQREKTLRFQVGLAPNLKYLKQFNPTLIDHGSGAGPSLGLACQLCSGMAATEVLRILLRRSPAKATPHYFQFDPHTRRFVQGRLWWGNRNPLQRLKLSFVRSLLRPSGSSAPQPPQSPLTSTGALSPEALEYLFSAGVQAPSGDNSQPWRFSVVGDTMTIHLDRAADPSAFDGGKLASAIACGAATENINIAATALGFNTDIRLNPVDSESPSAPFPTVATIRFQRGEVPVSPLVSAIWKRHTNRKPFSRRPLLDATRDLILQTETLFPGVKIHLVEGERELRRLAKTVCLADRLRAESRELHEHLFQMIRFSKRQETESKTGLPIKNLEVGLSGEMFLRCTRNWAVMNILNRVGVGRIVPKLASQGLIESSGAALITVPSTTISHFVLGGRALEHLWLALTHYGLSAQLMNALPLFRNLWQTGDRALFANHLELITEVWQRYGTQFPSVNLETDGHVALIRFGHCFAPVRCRTSRKPVESFMLDPKAPQ